MGNGTNTLEDKEYLSEKKDWQKFYKNQFNWKVDFSQVVIPEKTEGDWRLIFIARNMTMNFAFNKASKLFPTRKYAENLDKIVTQNIRNTQNSYAIWVKDGAEPDQKFLGQSTKKADFDMTLGITLLERIILEMKYFLETDNHLDIKGLTFCSGSRDSDGAVPSADWFDDMLEVDWYRLDYSSLTYGIRLAVGL